jgi:hypothetical protein
MQLDRWTDREEDKLSKQLPSHVVTQKEPLYVENLQLFKKYCYCIRQGLLLWDILAMWFSGCFISVSSTTVSKFNIIKFIFSLCVPNMFCFLSLVEATSFWLNYVFVLRERCYLIVSVAICYLLSWSTALYMYLVLLYFLIQVIPLMIPYITWLVSSFNQPNKLTKWLTDWEMDGWPGGMTYQLSIQLTDWLSN